MQMENERLFKMAKEMCEYAYAPYSGFRVGAAILTEDGSVFTGCNVENSSYGATICAERAAAVKAVSEGCRRFIKIAVANDSAEAAPCGICRQFLSEFAAEEMTVITYDDAAAELRELRLDELLPHSFELKAEGKQK